MRDPALAISAMGEAALLCETGRPLNEEDQRRCWAVARAAEGWPGVRETVPGMNTLLVIFDPFAPETDALEERLRDAWSDARGEDVPSRLLELPVAYGGAEGPDLADLAAHAGLSVDAAVRLHSGATYTVYAIGAVPGFPYLAGLDPRLARPRRDVPRPRMEAGSVIIGGVQAGIMAVTTPSGWHALGRTTVRLFDAGASPPALLAPGDRVRFAVAAVRA